jgi:hypothetical protein
MMSNSSLEMYVYRFIGMGPALAVMVVGVVLALRNLQRHPPAGSCYALPPTGSTTSACRSSCNCDAIDGRNVGSAIMD